MNILLLVVGIIFGVCVFIGYKKGLVKIVASLAATLVIILLVGMITPHISKWIQQSTPLTESVQKKVVGMLAPEAGTSVSFDDMEISREQQITLIEGAELPKIIQQMLLENNNSEVYKALGVNTFGEYVGKYVAKVIADIIAFLVAFVLVTIIVRVAIGVLGIIDKLPLIGGMNRIAGGVVGIGVGLLAVWVFFVLITLLYNTGIGATCLASISESKILTMLYDGNLLMKYIIKF